MEAFMNVMKTPGVSEEIRQEIYIQKRRKNIIQELNKIIELSIQGIQEYEIELENGKYIETIEEFNEDAYERDIAYSYNYRAGETVSKFYNLMICYIIGDRKIKGIEVNYG